MDLDLLEEEEGVETPEEKPEEKAAAPDVDGAVARALDARLGMIDSQLGRALGDVTARLSALEQSRQAPQGDDDGETEFDRFTKDPNAYLSNIVKAALDSEISPALKTTMDSSHKTIMREAVRELEASHGEGAFEEIRPIVEAGLAALSPAQRANADVVQTIIKASLGQDAVRGKMAEREARVSKAAREPASLLPNGAAVSSPRGELTESDLRYIENTGAPRGAFEAIAAAGAKLGRPPRTLSEMRAALRPKGKK